MTMKTTIEVPDKLLREVKVFAAKQGKSLKALIIEALQRVIAEANSQVTGPEWRRCFGAFRESADETAAIQRAIDLEFSKVDPREWK